MSLDHFAIRNNTDKSSLHHDYCQYYEDAIEAYLKRHPVSSFSLLEIGVKEGGSLRMWSEYLDSIGLNHRIVGIDLDPLAVSAQNTDKNIFVEIGDQRDTAFLSRIVEEYGPFDMIVDDGSHVCKHQHKSFVALFSYLKRAGIYVVEDVCTSYWPEYNDQGRYSMIEFCKSLVDDINFHGITANGTLDRKEGLLIEHVIARRLDINTAIRSIHFFNSTILIHKR